MALAIRAVATQSSGTSPRTVTKPAGTLAGDMMLLHVGCASDVAVTPPSGFTLVAEITGTNLIRVYKKIAGSSEPATYDVTFTSGNGSAGIISVYSTTANSIAVDVSGTQTNGSGDRIWPSVTTTVANTLLCMFATLANAFSSTPPGGATEQWDTATAPRIYLMTEPVVAAGATGTRTATGSATTSKVVIVALKEAAPAIVAEPLGRVHLFMLSPTPVFKARVNLAAATYPISSIPYDGVTLGAFGDIEFGMTIALGTADGLDDLGRGRIRDGSTGSALKVARSSQGRRDGEFDVVDNSYITVWDDYRVWARVPHIDSTDPDVPVFYKDDDIAVGTFTTNPPPVSNCGPGFAGTIDPNTSVITVTLPPQTNNSFAVADGATITTYLWDVQDGTITVGTSASSQITATFPAGFRWVKLTVTDSNGKTHFSRCPVYARNPAADTTVPHWQPVSRQITHQGQSIEAVIYSDIPRDDYPDGTLAMIWEGEAINPADRSHMWLIGWHDENADELSSERTATLKDSQLSFYDVMGRLDTIYGYPQIVEAATTADTWTKMVNPTVNKLIHYLLQWHSTALFLADYTPSALGSLLPFTVLEAEKQSIMAQVEEKARAMTPDHHFVCDSLGRLSVKPDPILQSMGDRSPTVQVAITEDELKDLSYTYMRDPRVHWLRSGAVRAHIVTDEMLLGTFFCVAPGINPGQGETEQTTNNKIALSQIALNACEGNRYARLNARHSHLRITLAEGDDMGIEPASMNWITLTLTAGNRSVRDIPFDSVRLIPWQVSIRYDNADSGLIKTVNITAEVETSGPAAVTDIQPSIADPPEKGRPDDYFEDNPGELAPPPGPPSGGIEGGQQVVAAIDNSGTGNFIRRTFDFQTPSGSGGPTWETVTLTTGETNHFSWVVDPFSPGYIGTGQTINGWVAGNDGIHRLTNLFGVATATEVFSFPTTASGASFHWRTIGASFGAYFPTNNPWLICVSYYDDTGGHPGTWATYSVDGGNTWAAEVQVSAFYDSGAADQFSPIALWLSPRTPGFALCVAYSATGNPATASAYATYDWGATWSLYASDDPPTDPSEPVPYWAVILNGEAVPAPEITWGRLKEFEIRAEMSGSGTEDLGYYSIMLVAPEDTKRVLISGNIYQEQSSTNVLQTSEQTDVNLSTPTGVGEDTDFIDDSPDDTGVTSVDFTLEWEATTTWPAGISDPDDVISGHPVNPNSYPHISAFAGVTVGSGESATAVVGVELTIVEIELQNGHIYTPPAQNLGVINPVNRLGGGLHIPWPDNDDEALLYHGAATIGATRQFRIKKVDGSTITDVSPNDGTRDYGCQQCAFGIRTFDSNRQYVLVAAIGNDTTASKDDDKHAVYVSSDYGATWTQVVAPVANSAVPAGRPGFSAAFGGDSQQIIFLWGLPNYISYSSNLGVAVDSRAGNLAGVAGFIGIAGGPL